MVKKTVVIHPRKTTVVKAPPKRNLLDGFFALIGAVLLIASGVLLFVLPEDDPVPAQYRVSFVQDFKELPSQSTGYLGDNEIEELLFLVEHDNVLSFLANTYFEDDLSSSLPDTLRVQIRDSNDARAGDVQTLTTPAPAYNQSDPLVYTAVESNDQLQFPVRGKPSDYIYTAQPGESFEDIEQDVLNQYRYPSKGNWTMRIGMVSTGDCPDGEDVIRSGVCRQEQPDGADLGDDLVIGKLTYQYYDIFIERIN